MTIEARISNFESDREARRRAVEETESSFVVEASAGTGKTSILISRILQLVLDKGPSGPPLPLSRICAITFTEKAASEMRVRLRQHFEQATFDERSSKERSARAMEALNDLETAAISTFHSFAVSLLKERPVEAGLDPRFAALDDIRGELFFREVWEPWINRALVDRNPTLEKALRNGFRLDGLVNLARMLRLNWLNVRGLECDPPPTNEQFRARILALSEQGKDFSGLCLKQEDRLAACLDSARDWLAHPDDGSIELSKPGNVGAAAGWSGGKDTVLMVREFLREVVEFRASCESLPRQRLLHEVVGWIQKDFMLDEWEKRKQAGGLIDFDDQLRLARDLLLNSKNVRREFQQQYGALLVDEFQDTDPIQWEIVLLLSATDVEENDPAKLRPEPGRLFIVGDPKQSIYRFRNADIETYLEIVSPEKRESLGLGLLELTTNFRSVPSILNFVDAAFESSMNPAGEESHYQGKYLPFGRHGHRGGESNQPSVSFLGDKNDESGAKSKTQEFVRRESKRIAGLIQEIRGSEAWKIEDRADSSVPDRRAPQYGDIAVLLPVLTHADVLEDAFRETGIPYVLEGGKFYYARSEVTSAITVLRAVANPNDCVALYGSLRSIFFGLSDEDLLNAHLEGIPLDYREEAPNESPLHGPFEILRDLHRNRHERRASETFEILLQKTGAREVLAASGFQSLANLGKLGRTLRSLQGDATFSQVVDLLGTMDEEGLAESESRLMEERSDAVRIISIHKSKGLDFPIVIVAGLGSKKVARSKSVLTDRRGKKMFALSFGSKDSGLQTPLWKEMSDEEKKKESAELVRLLYVGLTRARDYMILSTHTPGWKKNDETGQWVPATEGTRLDPLRTVIADCYSERSGMVRLIDPDSIGNGKASIVSKVSPSKPTTDWLATAVREYRELQALVESTPSSGNFMAAGQEPDASDPEDRVSEERVPEIAGNRGVRLGVAFHEAMERVDLSGKSSVVEFSRDAAMRHRLDPENGRILQTMIETCLASDLLDRARIATRSKRRIFREFTFVRPLNPGAIEEGKIDLLFEEEDGWVLVDYKTDWVSKKSEGIQAFCRNRYAGQVREYVDALRTLKVNIKAAYLLLARSAETVQII
jgi:ATP-dependent helicase/nuclease subunit A